MQLKTESDALPMQPITLQAWSWSYQVSREDEGVLDDPGHGGEGLRLPALEEGVSVGAVPELVGEVPVEVLPVGVGAAHPAARHVAAVALPVLEECTLLYEV